MTKNLGPPLPPHLYKIQKNSSFFSWRLPLGLFIIISWHEENLVRQDPLCVTSPYMLDKLLCTKYTPLSGNNKKHNWTPESRSLHSAVKRTWGPVKYVVRNISWNFTAIQPICWVKHLIHIPHICPYWYTTASFRPVKVHQKKRKFVTKWPKLVKKTKILR